MHRRPRTVKRAIAVFDAHVPFHDEAAVNVVLQAIPIVKPDIYIDGGDVGEWESVSHWQWKKKKRPPMEYQLGHIEKDIEAVNDYLDRVDNALKRVRCKTKHQVQGNHDSWLDSFVEENPYLRLYKFEIACRLKERGWTYWPMTTDALKVGNLYFFHGYHHGGINHSRMHLLKEGANCMYGHWHDTQTCTVGFIEGRKQAWSMGCLKQLNHESNQFLRGRHHNWQHAFAIVTWVGQQHHVEIIHIYDGQAVVWGKVLNGKIKEKGR